MNIMILPSLPTVVWILTYDHCFIIDLIEGKSGAFTAEEFWHLLQQVKNATR